MRAGIALGSNVGDRLLSLELAREAVLKVPGISGPVSSSSLYETAPVESGPDADPFLNAVLEVEFEGVPLFLLKALQSIEAEMGRPHQRARNSPRTIDLDILYLGQLQSALPQLLLPHPRLHLRRFVLQPLAEIKPLLILPGQARSIKEILTSLDDPAAVERAASQWMSL
jgi:2-amino-4-hydroxy-6-hydroxymethyldihydropteridine diphosphokinase